jgi:hypothetical protein
MKYTFNQIKSKTILIKFIEDEDEITEFIEINTVEDYCELEERLNELCEIEINNLYEKNPNIRYEDLKDHINLDYYFID